MELHRFTLEPFDSREMNAPRRQQTRRREVPKKEDSGMRRVYMQTAFCALIVAMLIVLELFVFGGEPEAVPASVPMTSSAPAVEAAADAEENGEEESLGRLQFVSGRVYSVFSPDVQWSLPVSPMETELLEDGTLLRLFVDAGMVVRAAAAGQVVSVLHEEPYGAVVRIHHGEGCESVYYGLGGVGVEEGQPLLAGDTIGLVGDNGELYLAAFSDGQPIPIKDRFSADSFTVI